MKKWIKNIIIIIISGVLVCGCSGNEEDKTLDNPIFKKIARSVSDDGWVYTFVYEDRVEGQEPIDGLINFLFYGINLRYRYNVEYSWTASTTLKDGSIIEEEYEPGFLNWGSGKNNKNDANKIDELLAKAKIDDLESLDANDLEFETMDKKLFVELVHAAIDGKEQEYGRYIDLPCYALLAEPEYIDGYKFQIGFLQETGLVDEIFIDILYQEGAGYNEYIQLSDIVETTKAMDTEKDTYEQLKKIEKAIENEDDFLALSSEYSEMIIDNIDFSRLFYFLKALDDGQYNKYVSEIGIISKETGND